MNYRPEALSDGAIPEKYKQYDLLPLGTENGNVSFLIPYAAISYEDYQERAELRK